VKLIIAVLLAMGPLMIVGPAFAANDTTEEGSESIADDLPILTAPDPEAISEPEPEPVVEEEPIVIDGGSVEELAPEPELSHLLRSSLFLRKVLPNQLLKNQPQTLPKKNLMLQSKRQDLSQKSPQSQKRLKQ